MFWLFPLTAQFENTNRAAMKNAVKFAVSFLPVTLIMSVAGMAYCAILLLNSMLWPFIPVFALSLMLYPQTLYVNRVFKKYRAEHKEVYADASGDI